MPHHFSHQQQTMARALLIGKFYYKLISVKIMAIEAEGGGRV